MVPVAARMQMPPSGRWASGVVHMVGMPESTTGVTPVPVAAPPSVRGEDDVDEELHARAVSGSEPIKRSSAGRCMRQGR